MRPRYLVLPVLVISISAATAGCAVPQPRGEGLYARVKEPQTGTAYHLYLPADYVRRNGRHPEYPRVARWPLVMTFHGMKPYDNARSQEREWEKEADTYGYIVCAPELRTSDSFMEYPLTKEHSYVLKDRENVMAIMDHIFMTTLADPKRVMSTGWGTGGYLAHYLVNRFSDRFSCIATRAGNFSAKLMIEKTLPLYKNRMPVAIFVGGLPAVKSESQKAVSWYKSHGFLTVQTTTLASRFRRVPEVAARFFAEQLPYQTASAAPSVTVPPKVFIPSPKQAVDERLARNKQGSLKCDLSQLPPRKRADRESVAVMDFQVDPRISSSPSQFLADVCRETILESQQFLLVNREKMKDMLGEEDFASAIKCDDTKCLVDFGARLLAQKMIHGRVSKLEESLGLTITLTDVGSVAIDAIVTKSVVGNLDDVANSIKESTCRMLNKALGVDMVMPDPMLSVTHDQRSKLHNTVQSEPGRARIGLNRRKGSSPLYLRYTVSLPSDNLNGADILWKDNGAWICDQPSGLGILRSPGSHQVSVHVITRENVEYRGAATVLVLPRGSQSDDPAPAVFDDELDLSTIPFRVHVVQVGDMLWTIAEQYYGHGKHWRRLLVANRNRLTHSTVLPVGMKLIIP